MSNALREILADFSVKVDTSAMKAADKAISGLRKSFQDAATFIGGAAVVGHVKGFVSEMINAEGQITDTSNQLGISTDDFQRWGLAAKLAGAETEDLAAGIRVLEKNMGDAAKGGPAAAAFKSLGVAFKDASGNTRPAIETLRDVGLAIADLPGPAERTKAIMELLGKGGTKLGPLFNDGAEGLNSMLAEMDRLGGGYSKEALQAMGKLGDETDKYDFALRNLKGQIAIQVLPVLSDFLTKLNHGIGGFKLSANGAVHLKTVLITLGAIGAAVGIAALAPWALMGLAIAATVLVVDDLVTAIRGGDSLIGRFIDKLFGKNASKGVFADMRRDLRALQEEINKEPPGGRSGFEIVVNRIWASLRKVPEEFRQAFEISLSNMSKSLGGGDIEVSFSKIGEGLKGAFLKALTPDNVTDLLLKAIDPTGLASSFSSAIRAMTDLGKSLIDGLIKGFTDGAKGFIDAAENAIGGAIDKIKEKIKPGSPSRVTTALAKTMPQGLVAGITSMDREVRLAADKMVSPVLDRVGNMSKSIVLTDNRRIVMQGGNPGPGWRSAMGLALNDDRDAMLAALEAIA